MIAPPLDEIDVLKHIEEDNDVKQNTFLDFEPHTPIKERIPITLISMFHFMTVKNKTFLAVM